MSLHIATLALSQFRSHPRAELAFDGRPVALFGDNGAGKTNLLEAISLLSPGRGLRRAAPEDLIGKPAGLGWRIVATVQRDGIPHEIETEAKPGQNRSVRLDGKAGTQAGLGRLAAILWLTPAMDRLWTEAPEGRRRFLDRLTLGFHPDHAEHALAYEKAMRQRNRLLREGTRDGAWYGALEAQMAQSGAVMIENRQATLARIAAAATDGAFPKPALSILDDTPPFDVDFAAALAEGRQRDMAAGRSLIGPHRADLSGHWAERDLPAAQCSTGEQKALLIALVLAHARATQQETGRQPIILLDEVAAHLDEGRRRILYDLLCDLGAQMFLTGTGPELFAPLGERAQAFRVQGHDGTSSISESDLQ